MINTDADMSPLYLHVGQIWASGSGGTHNPPSDLVWKTQPSWGTGDLFQTTLISANGEVLRLAKNIPLVGMLILKYQEYTVF